jgi:predicted O-linked N-acetylglucosamine transferase (SPINDLY family)
VPASQLLIGAVGDPAVRQRLVRGLAAFGIAEQRLQFHPPVPFQQYLALHHRVDLLLDTFPYPGGTTTHHGLWMGVPTLTRTGEAVVSWQCAGLLGRLGLTDFIAHDDEEFVSLARRWANDLPALAGLRSDLRRRVRDHRLLQPATVAGGMQAALRAMWRRWCAGQPAASFRVDGA